MYRIVAVFLWILSGWPDRTIRLEMIRVGSGGRDEPIATRWGKDGCSGLARRTIQGALPKQTGPKVVKTTALPCRKNFSDLWTLLTPLPPPRTCWEKRGLMAYRLGPTQRTSGSFLSAWIATWPATGSPWP